DVASAGVSQPVGKDEHAVHALFADGGELPLQVLDATRLVVGNCDAELLGGVFRYAQRLASDGTRVPKRRNAPSLRIDLLQHLESEAVGLGRHIRGQASDI